MTTVFTAKQTAFLNKFRSLYPTATTINRRQIAEVLTSLTADGNPVGWPNWLSNNMKYRAGRGLFYVPGQEAASNAPVSEVQQTAANTVAAAVAETPARSNWAMAQGGNPESTLIPAILATYIPDSNYHLLHTIIGSTQFYPVFITGLSGNGKTESVTQVCAHLKRELLRVNITAETDEDDLLGGFRLVNGQTVFHEGPVVEAMRRGAVLLLDEVDLGSDKIMCLQPVMEGKGVFLKKINSYVRPQPGFTVIATANTKGKGDDTGQFAGTRIMNEAFLERFPVTIQQQYPDRKTELKIISAIMKSKGKEDAQFADCLTQWSEKIRESYALGNVPEVMTTRRLINTVIGWTIFNDRKMAVELAIARFDADTRKAFMDFYTTIDDEIRNPKPAAATKPSPVKSTTRTAPF